MRRVNLWSVGDIEGLRAMKYPDDRVTCFNTLFSVPRMHDQLSEIPTAQDSIAAAIPA